MPRRSPRPTSTVGSDENGHQLQIDVEGRLARPARRSPHVTPQWSWATEFHLVLKRGTIKQHKFLTLMVCTNQDTRHLPCLPFSAAAIQTTQRDYILVDVRLSLQIRSSPPPPPVNCTGNKLTDAISCAQWVEHKPSLGGIQSISLLKNSSVLMKGVSTCSEGNMV